MLYKLIQGIKKKIHFPIYKWLANLDSIPDKDSIKKEKYNPSSHLNMEVKSSNETKALHARMQTQTPLNVHLN